MLLNKRRRLRLDNFEEYSGIWGITLNFGNLKGFRKIF